jgi:hypothetical protein
MKVAVIPDPTFRPGIDVEGTVTAVDADDVSGTVNGVVGATLGTGSAPFEHADPAKMQTRSTQRTAGWYVHYEADQVAGNLLFTRTCR